MDIWFTPDLHTNRPLRGERARSNKRFLMSIFFLLIVGFLLPVMF